MDSRPDHFREAVEGRLLRLRTDCIDLILLIGFGVCSSVWQMQDGLPCESAIDQLMRDLGDFGP